MEILLTDLEVRWRSMGARKELFDPCRKRWVNFTPEEWVRQHIIQYLLQHMRYPAALIAIEKEITIIHMRRRFDILVYDRNQQPWLMVECKAQDVELNQAVLDQILHYNMGVPVRYLVITNGNHTLGFERAEVGLQQILKLPDFP